MEQSSSVDFMVGLLDASQRFFQTEGPGIMMDESAIMVNTGRCDPRPSTADSPAVYLLGLLLSS
jgi:hypothetical protein